jgi:hypothetical protein
LFIKFLAQYKHGGTVAIEVTSTTLAKKEA